MPKTIIEVFPTDKLSKLMGLLKNFFLGFGILFVVTTIGSLDQIPSVIVLYVLAFGLFAAFRYLQQSMKNVVLRLTDDGMIEAWASGMKRYDIPLKNVSAIQKRTTVIRQRPMSNYHFIDATGTSLGFVQEQFFTDESVQTFIRALQKEQPALKWETA